MIFEADYTVIKKVLTTIQNTLTGTEVKKPDIINIELHVEEDAVYFSYKGEKELQLEYQMNVMGAESILEGELRISLKEMIDVMKSFDKNAGILMFERDGMELRIDDGVTEPEIITLSEENNLTDGFSLESPNHFVSLSKSWLAERVELARINNRTTFLPATSDISFCLDKNMICLRSFNLTNIYESTLLVEHNLPSQTFLMGKTASSRLSRLLKTVKEKDIHLYWSDSEMYVSTDDFVFKFYGEADEDGKALYSSLPIEGMMVSAETASFEISELKKVVKVEKGEETPESLEVKWESGTATFNTQKEVGAIKGYVYPFKAIQKIIGKWMANMDLSLGLEENCSPLIMKHISNETRDVFIVMGLEPEPLVANEEENFEKAA